VCVHVRVGICVCVPTPTRVTAVHAHKHKQIQAHAHTKVPFFLLTSAHVDLRKTSIAPGIQTSRKQLSPHRHCRAGVSPTGTPTSLRKRGKEGLGGCGGGGGGLREVAAKNIASVRKLAQGALALEKGREPWAEGAFEGEGESGHTGDGSEVGPEDLVLSQELASASQTETRLNTSSLAGSGAGEEKAFGWDIRPLTPSGEVDTDTEMSEPKDLSASLGPATPVLWV